jgi:uncharacterized protein (UPF0216 family)
MKNIIRETKGDTAVEDTIELPIKNRTEKVKIDKKDLKKLNGKIICYYDGDKRKFLYVNGQGTRKTLKLISLLYKPGTGSRIKYLDGDRFNLTSKNVQIIKSRRKIKSSVGTPKVKQIRDNKNFTIVVKDKILKFDKDDFLKLKGYTLIPRRSTAYTVFSKILKVNTTMQKFLFNVDSKVIRFKDGDLTNFKRDNLEFIDQGLGSLLYRQLKREIVGVKELAGGYNIFAKYGDKNFSISLNCTEKEAAIIYNYKLREMHDNKTLQINNTGLTVEEENMSAEKLLNEKEEYNLFVKKREYATSKYYGVSYNDQLKRWMCRATFKGQRYYMGVFKEEKNAAIAYNEKAIEILGDKARLNEIE